MKCLVPYFAFQALFNKASSLLTFTLTTYSIFWNLGVKGKREQIFFYPVVCKQFRWPSSINTESLITICNLA